MKFELNIGVYNGDDLVDTVPYVVAAEPLARIFKLIPEDSNDISIHIENIEVVFE